MGNTDTKRSQAQEHAAAAAAHRRWSSTQSQLSWASQQSVQSVASAQRPWSRACTLGRRRWQPSRDPWADWGSSKTPWPLTLAESLFLPEFPVRSRVQEASFQKVKLLSAGGFGSVHLVREKETGKCYAMKVLSKAQIVKEQAIQQCKDEVTIQAVLGRHPFVVPCTHHWQTRKQLFIVTEYVPHGELRLAWKALGGFSEKFVRLLIAELALVLDFLHCAGVIYRDLKMENVLLDEDAPEVLGAQPYCHAADWWSLGIMMYTLLVGRYPVEPCRDHVQMKQLVAETSYELPKGFSDPARKVVRKLLCKLPQKRLQSLHQLKWEPFFREVNFDDVLHKRISPKKILESEQNSRKMGLTQKGPDESQEGPIQAFAGFSCIVES